MRPTWIWLIFGLAFGVVLFAMGWTTSMTRRLERAEIEARRDAAFEENVRLSLWRMDSALAPVITQEIARPSFVYSAFYPAERPYDRMFAQGESGEVLVASPLLTFASPFVKLHFQIDSEGKVGSPQVPTGNLRALAETRHSSREAIAGSDALLREITPLLDANRLRAELPVPSPPPAAAASEDAEESAPKEPQGQQQSARNFLQNDAYQKIQEGASQSLLPSKGSSIERNLNEWQKRFEACEVGNIMQLVVCADMPGLSRLREGINRPLWAGPALLLARRVAVEGREYQQGCWLDWPALKTWLLSGVRDLLPDADLVAAAPHEASNGERLLAALPVRLVPGRPPADPEGETSPLFFSLGLAWSCVVLAGSAVAALLLLSLSLSERRKSFVSAVTHELRTPLTTFRMYSEMLAEGMVETEEKRKSYLGRLRTEADRLAHLVENVLAYARLESGRARRHVEETTLAAVIDRVRVRLEDRARDGCMSLEIQFAEEAGPARLRVDASAVEQILFNLVDNACKYASSGDERRIRISASRRGSRGLIRVEDRGPGIPSAVRGRLFLPFSRPAGGSMAPQGGVGLGLALSRRLAREMGGDLAIDESAAEGAAFVLTLSLAEEEG